MKIVCVQFDPLLAQVQRNIDHVDKMIADLKPEDVDILVLPEMAFTGYVFSGKDHIRPYLEDAETGPSVQWAKAQAVRFNAYVQVGYPEKRIFNEEDQFHEEFYNSICFVSPEGKLLTTYAKHFLYFTDETWAEEGPEFVGFGICMDVNPYQFKTEFTAFEFAHFHLKKETNLILCSMAWNRDDEAPKEEKVEPKAKSAKSKARKEETEERDRKHPESISHEADGDDDEWEDQDEGTLSEAALRSESIQYWAARMTPYYETKKMGDKDTYIVVSNRSGIEEGSTCVLRLSASGPEVVGMLSAYDEGVLKVEI
ncbi:Carbon-nitrogen hydrolase [Dissophora globulifera]|nr:Carbon-nitrogen hydrolase [Dissophora globulifera]